MACPLPPPTADQQYLYNSFGLAYIDSTGFLTLPTNATVAPGKDPELFNLTYDRAATEPQDCRFTIQSESAGACGTTQDRVACGARIVSSSAAYQTNGGKITLFTGKNLDNSDWLATSGDNGRPSTVAYTSRWNGEHVVKFLSSSFRERRLGGCSLCLPRQRPALLLRAGSMCRAPPPVLSTLLLPRPRSAL